MINSTDGRDRIEQLVERNTLFFHSLNATRILCLPIVPFVHSRCYGTNSKITCAQSFLFGACGIQKYTDTAILKNVVLVCSWQAHKWAALIAPVGWWLEYQGYSTNQYQLRNITIHEWGIPNNQPVFDDPCSTNMGHGAQCRESLAQSWALASGAPNSSCLCQWVYHFSSSIVI